MVVSYALHWFRGACRQQFFCMRCTRYFFHGERRQQCGYVVQQDAWYEYLEVVESIVLLFMGSVY